jgi:DNA-binding response OmpR family regulator
MSVAKKILLVEDEAPIRLGLTERLEAEGYRVVAVEGVKTALAALAGHPDLIILDRRLPDGEGLEVLRAARSGLHRPAVIVVSARGLPDDRIEGLEDGADDYVTKPFQLRELLARIKAVLSRAAPMGDADGRHLKSGVLTLDLGARTAALGRKAIELTRLEFDLLVYLIRGAGRAIDRKELLDRVWGYDRYPTTRTVDFHVLSLRRKLGPATAARLITVPGVGYRYDESKVGGA